MPQKLKNDHATAERAESALGKKVHLSSGPVLNVTSEKMFYRRILFDFVSSNDATYSVCCNLFNITITDTVLGNLYEQQNYPCQVSDSHSGDYETYYRLGCKDV